MEIEKMTIEELRAYAKQLENESKTADAKRLAEINADLDKIEARKKELEDAAATEKRAAAAVAGGAGTSMGTPSPAATKSVEEVRNSKAYIEAFAKYVKTGKDEECRALLSANVDEPPEGASGPVPVPTFVENRVRAAWENDRIFSRVRKTFVRGNLEIGFEVSSTDAAVHKEGADAPAEEEIVMGIVKMTPDNIKKWIKVSDVVLDMGAEEMLAYLYDELTYKIIKKAADIVCAVIDAAPQTSTQAAVGVPAIANDADSTAVINAKGLLGDEAEEIVAIMNPATEAAIKAAAIANNYAVDPFDGATVLPKKALPSYAEAEDGDTYMIVGDLRAVQANLPNGEAVKFVFDEYTYAEDDLVKIVGKLLAAIAVTGPEMLVKVVKGEVESE